MKYSIIFSTLGLSSLSHIVHALPSKRDGPSDPNFALTLEHLENNFYERGLAEYNEDDFVAAGFPSWVRGRFEQVAAHEAEHVKFLSTALGPAGVKPCEYKFPDNNVREFVDISYLLEAVGTSAYTGASGLLSSNYVKPAASILATEARHDAWINSAVRRSNPWNSAFETPIDMDQAFTLASTFIVSCPSSNPSLGLKAFPSLSVPASAKPGKMVALKFDTPVGDHDTLYAAFLASNQVIFEEMNQDTKEVEIPKDLKGTFFLMVTNSNEKVTVDTTVAGPAVVMFGFDSRGKAQ